MNLNVKAIGRLAYRLTSLTAITDAKFDAFMALRRVVSVNCTAIIMENSKLSCPPRGKMKELCFMCDRLHCDRLRQDAPQQAGRLAHRPQPAFCNAMPSAQNDFEFLLRKQLSQGG